VDDQGNIHRVVNLLQRVQIDLGLPSSENMDVSDGNSQGVNPGFLHKRPRLASGPSPLPAVADVPAVGQMSDLRLDRSVARAGHAHHFFDPLPVFQRPETGVFHHDRVEARADALLDLGQVVGFVEQKSDGRELARTAAARQL
jgi:hypothetical protein